MPVETAASRGGRASADALGTVVGSSYSVDGDEPVVWAFEIETGAPEHLVLAGAADADWDILLRCAKDDAFTTMLHGKQLFLASTIDEIDGLFEAPSVAMLREPPAGAAWFCDAFVLRPEGVRLHAAGVHVHEAGLNGPATLARVLERTPTLVTAPDPYARATAYRDAVKLVRGLRRLVRLRELDAPEIVIANDERMARARIWPSWLELPADVVDVAAELGLQRTGN